MEAILLVEGVGGFTGFAHMEDELCLDELLLLHEQLAKRKHSEYQVMAAVQGVEIPDLDSAPEEGLDDLPPEVLAAEKAWREKKAEYNRESASSDDLDTFGLGYKRE